jgi:ferritin
MLTENMHSALNQQINREFQAGYLYLATSAYAELANFTGAAKFFRIQAQEELGHAMRLFDYALTRQNAEVELLPIESAISKCESLHEAFERALESEQQTTESIRKLLTQAHDERDYATVNLLNWFAEEQAEEESLMQGILHRLEMVGDDGAGLLLIDHELGERGPVETGET